MPFEFTLESFRDFGQQMVESNGDQAVVTSLLADMQETVVQNVANLTKAQQEVEALTDENKRLKEANMNLYLRIGVEKDSTDPSVPATTEPIGINKFLENLEKEE